jgi:hypothetical protein
LVGTVTVNYLWILVGNYLIFLTIICIIIGLIWIISSINVYTKASKLLKEFKKIYYKYITKSERNFKPKFVYLKSPDIDKQFYIWKKTFIEAKIEKLWM